MGCSLGPKPHTSYLTMSATSTPVPSADHHPVYETEVFHRVTLALRYLQTHHRQQPSLHTVAQAVGYSAEHLQRTFSQWAGVSPKRFLQFLNKQVLMQRLRAQSPSLSAAYDLGLSSGSRVHDLILTCEAVTPGQVRASGAGVDLRGGIAPTPFGTACLGWTPHGLCHLEFLEAHPQRALVDLQQRWPAAHLQREDEAARRWVERIFAPVYGQRPLPVLLRGTNFQIKVWEALMRLPSATVVSYSDVAQAIGHPRAQRAVGTALAANTVGYLIPCHRVIRQSGVLGPYRWGADRKAAMIGWEAAQHEPTAVE